MKKSKKVLIGVLSTLLCISTLGLSVLYLNGFSGLINEKKAKENQIKVACVGDSITYGHGISFWNVNNYPSQLQKILGDEYCVNNYGASGYCVQDNSDRPYVSNKVYNKSLEFNPDILVMMLGTNDSKPYNWTNIENFKEDYIELLDSYLAQNKDLDVYLCTPATAFYKDENSEITSFDIQPKICDEISEFVKEYASENKYHLIDINKLTKGREDLISKDLIHPNNLGAKEIAKEVSKYIIKNK